MQQAPMDQRTPSQRRLSVLANQLMPNAPSCSNSATLQAPIVRQLTAGSSSSSMFDGQVVVITGAAKGIGEAAALAFAKLGAKLLLTDLDAAAVAAAAERCRQAGSPKVVTVAGDITAPEAAQQIASTVQAVHENLVLLFLGPPRLGPAACVLYCVLEQREFGRLDVLVNNAGFTWDGVIHKMSDKQWQAMLSVHITAPFRLIQAVTPLMREAAKKEQEALGQAAPRSIINISSTSGTHGNAGQANYAAGKAGIVGLTKTVAKEWGHLNIRCNAIAYGMIDTRLTRGKEGGEAINVGGEKVQLGIPGGDTLRELAVGTIPLARIGTAEEAAGAILMLASPWASYITGQVLEVNGGSYM